MARNDLRTPRDNDYYENNSGGTDAPVLGRRHRSYLHDAGISGEVIDARMYMSIQILDGNPAKTRRRIQDEFGVYVHEAEQMTGIMIPMYSPGDMAAPGYCYRPDIPGLNAKGKPAKYLFPRGRKAALDVNPLNRDKLYTDEPIWVTEGVKKSDCLTSNGQVVITLSGVDQWQHGGDPLPDWQSVKTYGRKVYVCFDADAATNYRVAQAMHDLGHWLARRGADVRYIVTPVVDDDPKTGADDFLVAGHTIEELLAVATAEPPKVKRVTADLPETEVYPLLAEHFAGKYIWVDGLGWLRWSGILWEPAPDHRTREEAARWVKTQWDDAMDAAKREMTAEAMDLAKKWMGYNNKTKIDNVLALAKGVLDVPVDQLDGDPHKLNVTNGTVGLRTGELLPHDPEDYLTKVTTVGYVPGARHEAWETALEAIPEDVRWWLQIRFGQATSGLVPDDDVLPFLKGGGANGKSTIMNAISKALGSYYLVVSPKALLADVKAHSTDLADFLGARFAVLEELPDRNVDVVRLKTLVGGTMITARHMHKDNMSFAPSHSLFVTTNYSPNVSETDYGTWRRLALVKFPFTYVDEPDATRPNQRQADVGLRQRITVDLDGRISEAVLAWLVEGARKWYATDQMTPVAPEPVAADTQKWRVMSDTILRFWRERLVADPDSVVPSTDMLRAYNTWAGELGFKTLGDKTFPERFGGHEETERNRVTFRDRFRPGRRNVSRFEGFGDLPDRIRAWDGVRLVPLSD